MEGAYNKVLAARQHLPAPCYAAFMDLLATTVRCLNLEGSGVPFKEDRTTTGHCPYKQPEILDGSTFMPDAT